MDRSALFEVQSNTQFRLSVEEYDPTSPLQVEMVLGESSFLETDLRYVTDAAGNAFAIGTSPDVAGQEDPFPKDRFVGCANQLGTPVTCTDVAVYRFSDQGNLVYASYLTEGRQEDVGFFELTPDGDLMLAGSTDSADFPVTVGALQTEHGGPVPALGTSIDIRGDLFATRLDPVDGTPLASTYLGGPDGDTLGAAALGPDGSLYFLPKRLGHNSAGMPTSPGALQADCEGDPCLNGYAAHISPTLDTLLYGTYLPGVLQATAKLHSDGSLYYGGRAEEGFPTTPTAFQREPAGGETTASSRGWIRQANGLFSQPISAEQTQTGFCGSPFCLTVASGQA